MPIPFERMPRNDRIDDDADAFELSAMPDEDEFQDELESAADAEDEEDELLGSALAGDDEYADDHDDEARGFGFGTPED
jgi:hypothetical protein